MALYTIAQSDFILLKGVPKTLRLIALPLVIR